MCPTGYISSWASGYTVALAKRQPASGHCVILTARNSGAAAKKAILTVGANFQPQKLVVSLRNGITATVVISSLRTGGASAANNFRFPSNKYRKVKVTDLR